MGTKRIEVDADLYEALMGIEGDDVADKLTHLLHLGWDKEDEIALVVLEDELVALDDHRGQPSVAPFFEGLTRFFEGVRVYRLNFYDAGSFTRAFEKALAVTERRVILYIGAHGSKGRIAGANARTIASRIAELGEDKLEGIILSACDVGAADDTLERMLESGANWVFGYKNSVNILCGMLLETAILKEVLGAEADYVDQHHSIVGTFAQALHGFSPAWRFGDTEMAQSVRLLVHAGDEAHARDATLDLVERAWIDAADDTLDA